MVCNLTWLRPGEEARLGTADEEAAPMPGLAPAPAVELEVPELGPGLEPGPGLRLTALAIGFPWIGIACRNCALLAVTTCIVCFKDPDATGITRVGSCDLASTIGLV